jgi:hypothetical protein
LLKNKRSEKKQRINQMDRCSQKAESIYLMPENPKAHAEKVISMTAVMQNSKLSDFEPEKIHEEKKRKDEEKQVMDLLERFSAEMLKDRLRNNGGHPEPEWGEGDTWRFHYIDECKRRGMRLLEQLGWPTDENALYINIHTGSIETLINVATQTGYFSDRQTISSQVWSIVEHWEPYNPDKPNIYRIAYLEDETRRLNQLKSEGKPNAYHRNEIERIPEYQKTIEAERSKIKIEP